MEPVLDASFGEERTVLVEALGEDGGRRIHEPGSLNELRRGALPRAGACRHEVEDAEHAGRNLALA